MALISFLVLNFPGLIIDAPPISTVQSKYIYTIFKVKIQETQFLLLCTEPSIDNHKFLSFKGGNSRGRYIGHPCHKVESSGSIYRPSVPQSLNRAGCFASHLCQADKFFRPIYQLTAAKGLTGPTNRTYKQYTHFFCINNLMIYVNMSMH